MAASWTIRSSGTTPAYFQARSRVSHELVVEGGRDDSAWLRALGPISLKHLDLHQPRTGVVTGHRVHEDLICWLSEPP